MLFRRRILLMAAILALVGCAPAPGPRDSAGAGPPSAAPSSRTLTMVVRYEVTDLAPKIPGSSSPIVTKRIFNAFLALIDGTGTARPYLAESLPQLNTDTWTVFPDGRMETIYRLRPGLAWHDGQLLTADDFVFAARVYSSPGLGIFAPTPQDQIEEVSARDPRTLVIRWKTPYPDADRIKDGDLEPLPRHVLEGPFSTFEADASTREAFINHPFWTTQYVGAGPYRLERWEPGSHLEGLAFDRHALGRPKIDRIIVRLIGDENTVLTNVLAGEVDFTADFTLRFEHALLLRREWEAGRKGLVLLRQSGPVSLNIQQRPEYVDPAALLDVRVRRAMAHSLDRQALNDGIFEGQGFPSESLVPQGVPYYSDADRALVKYLYDPRRTEQLMGEAGFTRDRDGMFASGAGQRFRTELRVTAGTEFERAQAILADTWRRSGLEVTSAVLSAAQARDVQARHTFPGMASRGGGLAERTWLSSEIGSAATNWVGENRSGWSNPDYDRLWESFNRALDRSQRIGHFVQMNRLFSEHLPAFMLHFSIQVNTHAAALHGPEAGVTGVGTLTPSTVPYWNMHEWELLGG